MISFRELDVIPGFFQCFQHHPASSGQDQLDRMQVERRLVFGITSHLADRPQYVRLKDITPDTWSAAQEPPGNCAAHPHFHPVRFRLQFYPEPHTDVS